MKEDWKIKKLTDVLWFQEGPGVRKHQYTTSGVKLLNVANLVNGKVDLSTSDRYISEEEAYGKYKHFLADEGDLILASSGIQVEYIEKKMGFITKEHLPLCMNTSTIRFKSLDKGILDIAFFMYFLKSFHFKEQLSKLITGIAQLNFGPSHLKQMTIPVPSLPEQKRIVAELDCLSGVIEKQKQQLKELDNLAKSIFYTTFGDPISNNFGWEKRQWETILKIVNGKNQSKVEDPNGEYPIYGSGGVMGRAKDYLCPANTVIIGRKGNINKPLYVREKMWNVDTAFGLVADNTILHPTYLYYYCIAYDFEQHNKAVTIPSLTKMDLLKINTPVPPIALQQEFAFKIEVIEKQKETIKQSIEETETLFNSRMDYYFN